MSTPINDGGPAFPGEAGEHGYGPSKRSGENWIELNQGMTLRDWFAGRAMGSMVGNESARRRIYERMADGEAECPYKIIANDAYEAADAMLAARAKGQP